MLTFFYKHKWHIKEKTGGLYYIPNLYLITIKLVAPPLHYDIIQYLVELFVWLGFSDNTEKLIHIVRWTVAENGCYNIMALSHVYADFITL